MEASVTPVVVHWEEGDKWRAILGYCKTCKASEENFNIVSPTGTAHRGNEWNEDHTQCGRDATGLDWWWRT